MTMKSALAAELFNLHTDTMATDEIRNQLIALAGLLQACTLVKNIAWTGRCDGDALRASLSSILKINSTEVNDIYGGISHLKTGLQAVITELQAGRGKPDIEVTRYAISLLHLQKHLMSNKSMTTLLDKGITLIQTQLDQFDISHINTIARLADLYQKTVSTIQPRILINGEHTHLSHSDNANRIRALLLAGIRSAVLFKQCKGSKIKLLFNRRRYVSIAEALLKQIT